MALCACSGFARAKAASTVADNFFITAPGSSTLTIIGVSGPQQKRESEIEIAREDAARKAAMYHGVIANYGVTQAGGTSIFAYRSEFNFLLEYDQQLETYMDRLKYDPNRDVAIINRTLFIRFTYPAIFPGGASYTFAKNPDGRPQWITNRPQKIGNFAAGVGYAARQSMRRDTFVKSYESALAEIVLQLYADISSRDILDGSQSVTTVNVQSTVNINNFLVLEVWIDPETQSVWTLAIAKKRG